jgi:hypothetical protein
MKKPFYYLIDLTVTAQCLKKVDIDQAVIYCISDGTSILALCSKPA